MSREPVGMSRGHRALAVAIAALAGLLIASSVAGAKTIEPYVFSGTSFNGAGSTAGTFTTPEYLAVNKQTGNVYVLDSGHGGVLQQFTASGTPLPFSDPSLGGGTSITIGSWLTGNGSAGADLVVDNSGTATQGNLYVLQTQQTATGPLVHGFVSSGAVIGPQFPICGGNCASTENWLEPNGLAVDTDGTPWVTSKPFVGTPPNSLNPFDVATGERSTTKPRIDLGHLFDPITGLSYCCAAGSTALSPWKAAFDSQNNFYVSATPVLGSGGATTEPVVMKYDKDGNLLNQAVTTRLTSINRVFGFLLDQQLAVDTSNDSLFVDYGNHVELYDPSGRKTDSFATGITGSTGVAVNPNTQDVYVTNKANGSVSIYEPGAPTVVPDVTTESPESITLDTATLTGTVNPDNGGNTTECFFEYGKNTVQLTEKANCAPGTLTSAGGPQKVTANISNLSCSFFLEGLGCLSPTPTKGNVVFYRLVTKNAAGPQQTGEIRSFRNAQKPVLGVPTTRNVNTDSVDIGFNVAPEGGETIYKIEYGTTSSYGEVFEDEFEYRERPEKPKDISVHLSNLAPATTYHYKVTATNFLGGVQTTDRVFRTFPKPVFDSSCPNGLSRQQTGAALLLDCRAYEIVSAAYQGGYAVESDLAPGQHPFSGYPDADGKALYAVHDGGIPNSGSPTNRGPDPYVATRGSTEWVTRYVGIPADGTPSAKPFASTLAGADSSLGTFAFGGEDICDPCFPGGPAGLPLRLADGSLVQGMAGSLTVADPEPAGDIHKPLSANGSHFVFGSEDKFETDGNENEVSIYDRNLETGVTKVVSKTPAGATMSGPGAADTELDISSDGSRILLGAPLGTDPKGNEYFHLYMNVGASSKTIDLTPGTTSGVRYDGMTADGGRVFFTTKDPLTTTSDQDSDTSADLFEAQVSPTSSTLTRVSTGSGGAGDENGCTPAASWNTPSGGPNCDVLAIAGAGGVATGNGSIYFLSPEKLDGAANGTVDQPNLYVREPGGSPRFVVTLEPANPAVVHGIVAADQRDTADFQVSGNGAFAVFTTQLSLLPDFENRSLSEVYRYEAAADDLVCVSCPPSNAPAVGDASLASTGLSILDDGRAFFNTPDPLVLRDANEQQDVYEWEKGIVELVSSGSNENDSSLLSASADGTDVFFYTRERLVPQDLNPPIVKLYTARENGGFFVSPAQQPCKASDECHGPGTVAADPPTIQSTQGGDGQVVTTKPPRCRKGFVRKNGQCKKKPRKKKKTHKRSTHRHR